VAETGDGGEAVRLAEAYRPDVAIVDFSMPVLNGVEAVRRIVERSPTTRVIMLCDYGDAAYLEHARSAGAVGFVVTDAAVMDLLAAVGEVLQGKSFTSPVLDTHRRRFTA
jgi:DNA-binding NarL/FixJ family response regulator